MSQSADFKSLFKAAKSNRAGAQKLSKKQIKALKAQKAAALASQGAERSAMPSMGRAASSEDDTRSMPPPPPRQPSAKPAASYHADSQATVVNNGHGAHAAMHPEPSVNQAPGVGSVQLAAGQGNTGSSEEVRSSHPEGTPAGSFQENVVSGVASSGAGAQRIPAVQKEDALRVQQAHGMSLEGSTGAVAGSNNGVDITSELSRRTHSQAQPSAVSGVPAGFFEETPHAGATEGADVTSTPAGATGAGLNDAGHQDGQAVPLPKGFFQDETADAKARGEVPKTKEELDKEFADFLKQVDVDAAEAAAKKAVDDADEAADKQNREEFEHIVRLQRLQNLKQNKGAADPEEDKLVASAAEAVSNPEVELPAIQLPKKRKIAETVIDMEQLSNSDSDDDEEAELLDWRAKKSSF